MALDKQLSRKYFPRSEKQWLLFLKIPSVCNCRIQGLLVKKLGSYFLEREEELVSVCHRVKYTDPRFSKSEFILACWYFRFVGCFFLSNVEPFLNISDISKVLFWSELLGIEFFGISSLTIWCRRCHSRFAKDDLQTGRKCNSLSKACVEFIFPNISWLQTSLA